MDYSAIDKESCFTLYAEDFTFCMQNFLVGIEGRFNDYLQP